MDDVTRRRWDKDHNPNSHKPISALKAIVDDIENGHIDPSHVVIAYYAKDDDGGFTGYFQAGDMKWLGAMGLLDAVKAMMLEQR